MTLSFFIENRNGDKLEALLDAPKQSTDKVALVTTRLGYWADSHPYMQDCANSLALQGIATIRFSFFNAGKNDNSFENVTISSEVNDFKDALDFSFETYKSVSVIGGSLGAAIATLGYDDRIKSLVMHSPAMDMIGGIYTKYKKQVEEKGFAELKRKDRNLRLGKRMLEEFKERNNELHNKLIEIKCPTLVVMGTKDRVVIKNRIEKYFPTIKAPKELVKIEGAGHDFSQPEFSDIVARRTADWIAKYA